MSADKSPNIQNDFFNRARKDGAPVTIYLTNGKKLAGRIRAFDKYTVIVESNRIEQMLFKHAISTVAFNRPGVGGPMGGGSKASSASSSQGDSGADSSDETSEAGEGGDGDSDSDPED